MQDFESDVETPRVSSAPFSVEPNIDPGANGPRQSNCDVGTLSPRIDARWCQRSTQRAPNQTNANPPALPALDLPVGGTSLKTETIL